MAGWPPRPGTGRQGHHEQPGLNATAATAGRAAVANLRARQRESQERTRDRARFPRRHGGPRTASRRRGGCHRCRRRALRVGDRLLPRLRGAGRAAAGKEQVPAGEGVRGWPDAARGQGPGGHGRADQRERRVAAQQGAPRRRRRGAAGAALAGADQLPRVRPGPQPARLRSAAGPARRQGRRAADRGRECDRPGHRRAHRPHHRRDRPARRRPAGRQCRRRGGAGLPGPPGDRRGRELLPPVGVDGPAQAG